METIELLQYLRFREVQKILDELLRQRLIDPVMYDMVLRKYQRICSVSYTHLDFQAFDMVCNVK